MLNPQDAQLPQPLVGLSEAFCDLQALRRVSVLSVSYSLLSWMGPVSLDYELLSTWLPSTL